MSDINLYDRIKGTKPCPFCGDRDITAEAGVLMVAMYCGNCGASGPPVDVSDSDGKSKEADFRDAAIVAYTKWQDQVGTALVEELKKEKDRLDTILRLGGMSYAIVVVKYPP